MLQTVLFPRDLWSTRSASRWLMAHGLVADKVDKTVHFLRFRQVPPPREATYRTRVTNAAGRPVHLVYARPAVAALPPPRRGGGTRRIGQWDLFSKNRETSDAELAAWGKKHIPGFLGVRARSQFSDLYPRGQPMAPGTSCVLNLDFGDYSRGGTHWVAVRVSSEAPLLLYVDSFGLPPPREVTLRGRRDGRGILYPDIQNQLVSEVNCGPRALAVLHYLAEAAARGQELSAFGKIGQTE